MLACVCIDSYISMGLLADVMKAASLPDGTVQIKWDVNKSLGAAPPNLQIGLMRNSELVLARFAHEGCVWVSDESSVFNTREGMWWTSEPSKTWASSIKTVTLSKEVLESVGYTPLEAENPAGACDLTEQRDLLCVFVQGNNAHFDQVDTDYGETPSESDSQ